MPNVASTVQHVYEQITSNLHENISCLAFKSWYAILGDVNRCATWLIKLLTEKNAIPVLNPGAHNGDVIAYDVAPRAFWELE